MRIFAAVLTVVCLLTTGVVLLGDSIRSLFGMTADALAGEATVAGRTTRTRADALEMKKLSNFAKENEGYGAPALPSGNTHEPLAPNGFVATADDALSTFAIDVDTASYALGRRTIRQGWLPAPAGVRVEEWVNAFKYELPTPNSQPFAVHVEGAPSPYAFGRTLLKVALQGRVVPNADRKPAHLVFLVDTSGSMSSADRLPLAQEALRVLVQNLNARDTVALVTYAGSTQVVLEPTPAENKGRILEAIDSLSSGGGTAMGSGMELAYGLAVRQVRAGSVTRVVVLTDGDANIGRNVTADDMLKAVKAHVAEGVLLTTVGFGMGNYRDSTLERLADHGNGQAVYVDSLAEAQRVFGRDVAGTLEPIAKDVKVQVAFDPKAVSRYRLVGYENRDVRDEDFRDDAVDGGELGAGHSVTALYEVELTGARQVLGTVFLRGQRVDGGGAFEVEAPVTTSMVYPELNRASTELRFATAVALAADHLRGNGAVTDWPLERIQELAAESTRGVADREELVELLGQALALQRAGRQVAQAHAWHEGY